MSQTYLTTDELALRIKYDALLDAPRARLNPRMLDFSTVP